MNESVSFCENGDENDGILFKTGENEEVVQTLGENLVKMRCFLVVGLWAGTAREKWPCPTGGTAWSDGPRAVPWAVGQARSPWRHGTAGTTARRGKTPIGPARHDVGPCRAGTARWPSILAREKQSIGSNCCHKTRIGWDLDDKYVNVACFQI